MKYLKAMNDAPVVIGTNHAISLGWQLRLVCDDARILEKFRSPKKLADAYRRGFPDCRGLHVTWPHVRQAVIFIDGGEGERRVPMFRLLELVVHEVSHAVDFYFERACVKTVDTEFRAYYNDWICGQIFRMIEGVNQ